MLCLGAVGLQTTPLGGSVSPDLCHSQELSGFAGRMWERERCEHGNCHTGCSPEGVIRDQPLSQSLRKYWVWNRTPKSLAVTSGEGFRSIIQTKNPRVSRLSDWGGQSPQIFCTCKTRQQFFTTWLYLFPGFVCSEEKRIPQRTPGAGSRLEIPLSPWKRDFEVAAISGLTAEQGQWWIHLAQLWGKLCLILTREHGSICVDVCSELGQAVIDAEKEDRCGSLPPGPFTYHGSACTRPWQRTFTGDLLISLLGHFTSLAVVLGKPWPSEVCWNHWGFTTLLQPCPPSCPGVLCCSALEAGSSMGWCTGWHECWVNPGVTVVWGDPCGTHIATATRSWENCLGCSLCLFMVTERAESTVFCAGRDFGSH